MSKLTNGLEVQKLTMAIENFEDFKKAYHIRAKQLFGTTANALWALEHTKFENEIVSELLDQDTVNDMNKETRAEKKKYKEQSAQLTADLVAHIDAEVLTYAEHDKDWDTAQRDDDFIKVWCIITDAVTPKGLVKVSSMHSSRAQLQAARQGNTPIDQYCAEWFKKWKITTRLGSDVAESTIVHWFLVSLNSDFERPVNDVLTIDEVASKVDTFIKCRTYIIDYHIKNQAARAAMNAANNSNNNNSDSVNMIDEPKKKYQKRSNNQDSSSATCLWCNSLGLNHHHNTLECRRLKSLINDNEKPKGKFIEKPKRIERLPDEIWEKLSRNQKDEYLLKRRETSKLYAVTASPYSPGAPSLVMSTLINDQLCTYLDTAAAINVFKNTKGLIRIRKSTKLIQGVTGLTRSYIEGLHPSFGWCSIVPTVTCNLVSWAQTMKGNKMEYKVELDEFHVTGATTEIFKRCSNGFYALTEQKHNSHIINIVSAKPITTSNKVTKTSINVGVDKSEPTLKEKSRATALRELHIKVGHIGDESLIKLLDNCLILDTECTSQDVRLAAKYLPECIACKAGKTKAPPALPSRSKLPEAAGDIIHADILFGRGTTYLITVDGYTGYLIVEHLKNKTTNEVQSAISIITNRYLSYGIKIKSWRCDHENVIKSCTSYINSLGAQLIQTAPGHHERKIERFTSTIRNRICTLLNALPYSIPDQWYGHLIKHVIKTINISPNTSTTNLNPYTMIHGNKVSTKYLGGEFGQVYLTRTPNLTDKEASKVAHCIYIGNEINSSNCIVYDLDVHSIVIRRSIEKIEMTDVILKLLRNLNKFSNELPNDILSHKPVISKRKKFEIPKDAEVIQDKPSSESIGEEQASSSALVNKSSKSITIIDNDIQIPIEPTHLNEIEIHNINEDDDDGDEGFISLPDEHEESYQNQVKCNEQEHEQEFSDNVFIEPGETIKKIYNISVHQALKDTPELAREAIKDEFIKITNMETWKPINRSNLNPIQWKNIIGLVMFLKEKKNPITGEVTELRARACANGSMQAQLDSSETSSPTVSTTSINLLLCQSVLKKRKLTTLDVRSAFLHAKMKNNDIIVKIPSKLTQILVEAFPEYDEYKDENQCILMELHGALYGLTQAPLLWYNTVSETLYSMGFKTCIHDKALFVRDDACIALHVDDMLVSSEGDPKDIIEILESKYGALKITNTNPLPFLGISISIKDDHISLSQPEYVRELCEDADDITAIVPANENICQLGEDELLNEKDKKKFINIVMRLLYLSTRTRPDISFSTNILTTRTTKPTVSDSIKAYTILQYINSTKNKSLILKPMNEKISGWADSSWKMHVDSKGHTGSLIDFGGATIFWENSKQKLTSMSSTEAELIGASETVKRIMFVKYICDHIGYPQSKINLMQDNISTIRMIMNGRPTEKASKHIDPKYFLINDHVVNGDIVVNHVISDEHLSDGLTKALVRTKFEPWREKILLGYDPHKHTPNQGGMLKEINRRNPSRSTIIKNQYRR